MKTFAKILVLMTVVLLITSAFAGDKSITVNSPTVLNGQKIAPGDYKLSYTTNGSNAEVKVLQGKKVVATATGKVEQREKPAPYNGIVNRTNDDGSRTIVEIQFANEKSVIHFDTDNTAVGK